MLYLVPLGFVCLTGLRKFCRLRSCNNSLSLSIHHFISLAIFFEVSFRFPFSMSYCSCDFLFLACVFTSFPSRSPFSHPGIPSSPSSASSVSSSSSSSDLPLSTFHKILFGSELLCCRHLLCVLIVAVRVLKPGGMLVIKVSTRQIGRELERRKELRTTSAFA